MYFILGSCSTIAVRWCSARLSLRSSLKRSNEHFCSFIYCEVQSAAHTVTLQPTGAISQRYLHCTRSSLVRFLVVQSASSGRRASSGCFPKASHQRCLASATSRDLIKLSHPDCPWPSIIEDFSSPSPHPLIISLGSSPPDSNKPLRRFCASRSSSERGTSLEPQPRYNSRVMTKFANHVAENVLGTIGAVCWSVQLLPQIVSSTHRPLIRLLFPRGAELSSYWLTRSYTTHSGSRIDGRILLGCQRGSY